MEVYKFGGASVKDADAVRNVTTIFLENDFNEKVVVISAMGKTTNELENVVNLYYAGNADWEKVLDGVFNKHLDIIKNLYRNGGLEKATEDVKKIIDGAAKFLKENNSRSCKMGRGIPRAQRPHGSPLLLAHGQVCKL